MAIFRDEEDFSFFLRRLKRLRLEAGFRVLAYCLMTNHYHLVLETGDTPLQKVMHRLLTAYARVFNDRWTLVGHPFQGRYQARLISTDNDLRAVICYVHRNPIEAGMVGELDAWPWSSHPELSGKDDGMIDRQFVLDLFGGISPLNSYREFVCGADPPVAEVPTLEDISLPFGGAASLASRDRSIDAAARRRAFASEALASGYRRSQIAAFLRRTNAAVSLMLKGAA